MSIEILGLPGFLKLSQRFTNISKVEFKVRTKYAYLSKDAYSSSNGMIQFQIRFAFTIIRYVVEEPFCKKLSNTLEMFKETQRTLMNSFNTLQFMKTLSRIQESQRKLRNPLKIFQEFVGPSENQTGNIRKQHKLSKDLFVICETLLALEFSGTFQELLKASGNTRKTIGKHTLKASDNLYIRQGILDRFDPLGDLILYYSFGI